MKLPPEIADFLTDDEKRRLTLLRIYAGPEPVPTSEIEHVLEWANRARLANAMLDTVLAGAALPCGLKDKSDPDSMQLRLTEKGEARAKGMLEQLEKAEVPQ